MKLQRWSLLLGLLIATPAMALTPPWDDAELEAQADLIVQGHTGAPLVCTARLSRFENGTIGRYAIPLVVEKVIKGKTAVGGQLSLRFLQYFYKPGYSGDQDADHYPGERGRYYLQRLKEEGHVRLVHWSGVTVLTEGKGSLPTCR